MERLFYALDKSRVNKRLDADTFIRKANLTAAESRLLKEYLSEVIIRYLIRYPNNSELVVIEAVVGCYYKQYTFQRIAEAIASSIPNKVLVLVRYKQRAKLVAFITAVNRETNFRMSIKQYACSSYFWLDKEYEEEKKALSDIESIIINSQSADICCRDLVERITLWRNHYHTEWRPARRMERELELEQDFFREEEIEMQRRRYFDSFLIEIEDFNG